MAKNSAYIPYSYQPLESETTIRVLLLHPATRSEPLTCDLIHIDRATSQAGFDAVSYTWGNPDFCAQLPLSGNQFLMVTPTVYSLLRHIRHPTKTRRLWADAVCLNQADSSEKAEQVPLMGDIYRQAQKVRIWLGEADATIPRVWAILKALAGRGGDISAGDINTLADKVAGPFGIRYLHDFLRQPWFTRRWIIQEVSVSHIRTVHCGPYKIPWDWMVDAFEVLLHGWGIAENPSSDRRSEVALWHAVTFRKRFPELLKLLWEFDKSECFDPRDRIFALLGLARDVGNSRRDMEQSNTGIFLPVTYDRPWAHLYVALARSSISHSRGVTLLNHLIAFGSLFDHDRNLPSWVPNWSRPRSYFGPTGTPRKAGSSPAFDMAQFGRSAGMGMLDDVSSVFRIADDGRTVELTCWRRAGNVIATSGLVEKLVAEGEAKANDGNYHFNQFLDIVLKAGFIETLNKEYFPPVDKMQLAVDLQDFAPRWSDCFLDLSGHGYGGYGRYAISHRASQVGDLIIYENPALDAPLDSVGDILGCVLRPEGEAYRFISVCLADPLAADPVPLDRAYPLL